LTFLEDFLNCLPKKDLLLRNLQKCKLTRNCINQLFLKSWDMESRNNSSSTGVDSTNMFLGSFYPCRSQKRKKTVKSLLRLESPLDCIKRSCIFSKIFVGRRLIHNDVTNSNECAKDFDLLSRILPSTPQILTFSYRLKPICDSLEFV